MTTKPIAEQVADQLEPYLGKFNAQIAVKTFARRSLGLAPDQLRLKHLGQLIEALRPMLCTLAGRLAAERALEKIQSEVT